MGDGNDLLVDTGWFIERTPKQAIQVIRSLEPFRPFFVEEILHPEDYDGYAQVAGSVETLIACGEQEATEWGFHQLIESGQGGHPAARPDAVRRVHRGSQNRPHGRTGERAGDSALLVFGPADRRLAAPECISAARGLR